MTFHYPPSVHVASSDTVVSNSFPWQNVKRCVKLIHVDVAVTGYLGSQEAVLHEMQSPVMNEELTHF